MPAKKKKADQQKKTSLIIGIWEAIKNKIFGFIIWVKNYFFSQRFLVFLGVLFLGIILCYVFLLLNAKRVETLMTFPGRDVNLKQLTNHPAGLIAAEKINITSRSWENINGLYIDNGAEKTVYYFHGNGAPMDHFYTEMRYIADMWYNLMSYDFPWYGESTGMPHKDLVDEFSEDFYTVIQREKWLREDDMIVWWYSIGTAVALEFAKEKDFDSLVLFSPLASRYDMSSKAFWFPLQKLFFLSNSYISRDIIRSVDEPTLIVHGNNDIVVPFIQGEEVFENAWSKEKYFIEIDDFGHSLITERYGDVLEYYVSDFLEDYKLSKEKIFLDRERATEILSQVEQQNFLSQLDMLNDSSYQKYVDPSISYTQIDYIPEDMRRLERGFVIDVKGDAQLREQAADAFEDLSETFFNEFGEKVSVVSSYRSYAYQAGIKARWCPDNLCAKAGHSEHQSGLWIDLWSASSKAYWDSSTRLTNFYNWLEENAHLFWFHNPYRNGVQVDGYEIEPWHWRYVWERFASYLREEDITFAEYYYKEKK